MIFKESVLKSVDNSGVKKVKCIKVLGKYPFANPGSILVVSIKHVILKKTKKKKKKIIKKGEIFKALVVRTKYGVFRKIGENIKAETNAVIILKKESKFLPYANRIKGPVFREIRRRHSKVLVLAANVI